LFGSHFGKNSTLRRKEEPVEEEAKHEEGEEDVADEAEVKVGLLLLQMLLAQMSTDQQEIARLYRK
jgi:hypothetical protein